VDHHGVDITPYTVHDHKYVRATIPCAVVASAGGVVASTGISARGQYVTLKHKPGIGIPAYTFYQHLAARVQGITSGQRFEPGQLLGVMGFDPTDPARITHLHFETWAAWNVPVLPPFPYGDQRIASDITLHDTSILALGKV